MTCRHLAFFSCELHAAFPRLSLVSWIPLLRPTHFLFLFLFLFFFFFFNFDSYFEKVGLKSHHAGATSVTQWRMSDSVSSSRYPASQRKRSTSASWRCISCPRFVEGRLERGVAGLLHREKMWRSEASSEQRGQYAVLSGCSLL